MNNQNSFLVCVRCFTFNHAPYIKDAMDGFCIQQTSFPYICVIVDDASTDGEQDVIKSYLAQYFNLDNQEIVRNEETNDYVMTFAQHKINKNCFFAVYYLKYNHYSIKKNKFPYFAEYHDNAKYTALCEGDDYWIDSLKLQKQVDFLESHDDYTLIGGNANIYTSDGRFLKTFSNMESNDLTMDTIISRWALPTASMLYRITVVNRIPYIKNAPQGDIIVQMTCADLGKCRYDSTVCCVYRWLVPGSATARVRNNQLDYYLRHYDMWVKLNEYFEYKYDKAIQNRLKETNRKIIRERIYLKYPILKKIREIYRSFRGY